MSLVEWNPFRNMDRDILNFMDRSPFRLFSSYDTPKVDIYEAQNNIIVKAEIPGVLKEDMNVYVDENSVRLSGESKKSTEYKDENIYRSERYFGSFSRTISLPVEVNSDRAIAEYKDGVLSITVPKAEGSKVKSKRIDIQ